MSWLLAGEPPLDLDDIQGHILMGFGAAPQALGAYTAADREAAARTVGRWAERVTSSSDLRHRKYRRARDVIASSGPWVGVAVSRRLLEAAGMATEFDDDWFLRDEGMSAAGDTLFDPPPDDWAVGRPEQPVDVLVIVAAGATSAALEILDWFEADGAAWIEHRFREPLCPLPGGIEHFGFRDGLSQPGILGTVDGEPFEQKRLPDDGGIPYGAPGQELIWPGEFIYGYQGRDAADARRPTRATVGVEDAATNEQIRNGSLLVYRRLGQDVAAFRAFCSEQAAELAPCMGEGFDAERLEALLVGRWKNGVPVARAPDGDTNDPALMNGFTFGAGDDMRRGCPLSAHIRKVNPRNGVHDVIPVPRLLRRGAPYGPPYVEGEAAPPEGGRGLAFVSYQTRIVDQFGTLTARWMNDAGLPPGEGGQDLLVGQAAPGEARTLDLRGADGGTCVVDAGTRLWVTVTGGAFLFAPPMRMLRAFAGDAG